MSVFTHGSDKEEKSKAAAAAAGVAAAAAAEETAVQATPSSYTGVWQLKQGHRWNCRVKPDASSQRNVCHVFDAGSQAFLVPADGAHDTALREEWCKVVAPRQQQGRFVALANQQYRRCWEQLASVQYESAWSASAAGKGASIQLAGGAGREPQRAPVRAVCSAAGKPGGFVRAEQALPAEGVVFWQLRFEKAAAAAAAAGDDDEHAAAEEPRYAIGVVSATADPAAHHFAFHSGTRATAAEEGEGGGSARANFEWWGALRDGRSFVGGKMRQPEAPSFVFGVGGLPVGCCADMDARELRFYDEAGQRVGPAVELPAAEAGVALYPFACPFERGSSVEMLFPHEAALQCRGLLPEQALAARAAPAAAASDAAALAAPAELWYYAGDSKLNVRASPSKEAASLAMMDPQADCHATGRTQGSWMEVACGGTTGWSMAEGDGAGAAAAGQVLLKRKEAERVVADALRAAHAPPVRCAKGHRMEMHGESKRWTCDDCQTEGSAATSRWCCVGCASDVCQECAKRRRGLAWNTEHCGRGVRLSSAEKEGVGKQAVLSMDGGWGGALCSTGFSAGLHIVRFSGKAVAAGTGVVGVVASENPGWVDVADLREGGCLLRLDNGAAKRPNAKWAPCASGQVRASDLYMKMEQNGGTGLWSVAFATADDGGGGGGGGRRPDGVDGTDLWHNGRRYFVLPELDPDGVAVGPQSPRLHQDKAQQHTVPAGAEVVDVSDLDWQDVLDNVVKPFAWGTHVLVCQDRSKAFTHPGFYGAHERGAKRGTRYNEDCANHMKVVILSVIDPGGVVLSWSMVHLFSCKC